jgi:hypothetical protein
MPQINSYDQTSYEKDISDCIELISIQKSFSNKLVTACEFFLDKPYQLWCTGDGQNSAVNQKPIFRTDFFDCVSFVNTIVAIINSKNITEFKEKYIAIKYKNSNVNYLYNNYFIEEDWLSSNEGKYIYAVNTTIANNQNLTINLANTTIDHPNWIKHHSLENIFYLDDAFNAEKSLADLLQQAHLRHPKQNTLSYFTTNELLSLKKVIYDKPLVAIIIKPNWDVQHLIGTHLNISHLGIYIPNSNIFYHASSFCNKVVKIDFNEYMIFSRDQSKAAGFAFYEIINNASIA